MTKKCFKTPSSSDSNLSDNKRCYSSSSTSNFEESPIIISESHENLNREDYLIKRKKNNASARKCREKRKKQMAMVFTNIVIWNILKALSKVNSIKLFIDDLFFEWYWAFQAPTLRKKFSKNFPPTQFLKKCVSGFFRQMTHFSTSL